MLERLEHRRLLSAVLEDGVLAIGGTNGHDEIQLSEAPSINRLRVVVNGTVRDFDLRKVDRVVINANAGHDRVVLGQDPDVAIDLFVPYEVPTLVLGGRGQDTIYGGWGNDTLDGGTGVNELDGRGGDDVLRAGGDTDDIRGGFGTDTVDYADRTESINVTLDDVAGDGRSPPQGDAVVLVVFVPERDNVHSDIENVLGGAGDDEITGNRFNNVFSGGGGHDLLFGGFGRDILNGNAGKDRLVGGAQGDLLIGGAGNDTADYSDHAEGVFVTLDGVANDGLYEPIVRGFIPAAVPASGDDLFHTREADNARPDIENVIGTEAIDWLVGNDGSNTLVGRGGNDHLEGGAGNDYLRGGEGNDGLFAQDGLRDIVDGERGDDTVLAVANG